MFKKKIIKIKIQNDKVELIISIKLVNWKWVAHHVISAVFYKINVMINIYNDYNIIPII